MAPSNASPEVTKFVAELEHPDKKLVEEIRSAILGADEQISERIKWNAPSFCWQDEDRVTMNLRAKVGVQLVFHRGAKVKDGTDFEFDDPAGLMNWKAADRAVVEVAGSSELTTNRDALTDLVVRWMRATAD